MLQKKKIIVLRPRSLPQPFQNPPIRPLGQHLRRDRRNTKLFFCLMMFPRRISFGHDRKASLTDERQIGVVVSSGTAFHLARCSSPFSGRQFSRCRLLAKSDTDSRMQMQ
jgi:hypothetical protein